MPGTRNPINPLMNNKALPILLIEDNAADAVLVREYLNEASVRHDLFHADTLFEGIEIVRDRGDVQMILLDLTLPDSAGFRTLTSLLEKGQLFASGPYADGSGALVGLDHLDGDPPGGDAVLSVWLLRLLGDDSSTGSPIDTAGGSGDRLYIGRGTPSGQHKLTLG